MNREVAAQFVSERVNELFKEMCSELSPPSHYVLVNGGFRLAPAFSSLLSMRLRIPWDTAAPAWGTLLATELLQWSFPNGQLENIQLLSGIRFYRDGVALLGLRPL